MKTPLEICINNVNNDVGYITYIDDSIEDKNEQQVNIRLTQEQYDLVQEAIWSEVQKLLS